MVACFLCSGAAIAGVVEACIKNKHTRSLNTIDGPLDSVAGLGLLDARSTRPGYCSGTGLAHAAMVILPSCLKPAMQMSCSNPAVSGA